MQSHQVSCTYDRMNYMSAIIPYHFHCWSISWAEMKSWPWKQAKCHSVAVRSVPTQDTFFFLTDWHATSSTELCERKAMVFYNNLFLKDCKSTNYQYRVLALYAHLSKCFISARLSGTRKTYIEAYISIFQNLFSHSKENLWTVFSMFWTNFSTELKQ